MKTSSERAIVHLNVTDFAVAVERIIDVTLRSRSLIITPSTNPRATVYDMSDEAWQDGVRKGMKLADALRRSPRALLRPPQPLLYEKAMISILRHARQFSPFIEHGRADGHFFLDLTGTKRLFGPPHDAASRLFREIDKQTGLQPIWTTATSKVVGKVAARLVRPQGEYIVPPGKECAFLAPLSPRLLPDLLPKELRLLEELNLITIHQLASLSQNQLQIPFGSRSLFIHEMSRGRDHTPLLADRSKEGTIQLEHNFPGDVAERKFIEAKLEELAAGVARRLRQKRLRVRRISLEIFYSDNRQACGSSIRKQSLASDQAIALMTREAFAKAWKRRIRLKGVILRAEMLEPEPRQMTLFEIAPEELHHRALSQAKDAITKKFGDILSSASQLHYKNHEAGHSPRPC